MYKNPIIVFEGIEASGKSTNIKIISNYLDKINRKYIKIREPGGSKYSENIRKFVLSNKSNLNFKTDFLLMLASRSENIDKILKKNYGKKIILIDRFNDSTIAYQHYGMGINLNLINKINNYIVGKYKANLTFLSVVNKKNMKKRLKTRVNKNRYDKFNYSFYSKVQKGYIKISKQKNNYLIIDSNKYNKNECSEIIINKINSLIT